jgi:type II secretory pathway predicted ATPase ExeA
MVRLVTRPVPDDTAECFRELARRLRTMVSDEQPAALVIDDAHILADRDLGHVLTAYDSLRKALHGRFRLLLAADPALELRLPQLRSEQLDAVQVLDACIRLFGRAVIAAYLDWRLQTAGGRPSDIPFDAALLDRIAAASEALPRSVEAAAAAELNARWGHGA